MNQEISLFQTNHKKYYGTENDEESNTVVYLMNLHIHVHIHTHICAYIYLLLYFYTFTCLSRLTATNAVAPPSEKTILHSSDGLLSIFVE